MYAQVVALRAYTTLIYKLMNNPLRDDARYRRGDSCPLPVLTYFAVQVPFFLALLWVSCALNPVEIANVHLLLSVSPYSSSWMQLCAATQGIKKLRALHAEETKETVLWRGMRSSKVTANFMHQVCTS